MINLKQSKKWFVYTFWHRFWQVYKINQNKFTLVNGCEVSSLLSAGIASDYK